MSKKVLALILLLTMFSMFFTSCGEVEQTNNELTIAYWGDYDFSIPAIEKYRKLFPNVEVNTVFTPSNGVESFKNFVNKQQAELMAGSGPDVVIFKNTRSIEKLMRSGVFADMSPFFDADDEFNINDYQAVVFNAGKYNDCQYVIPISYSVPLLVTSKKSMDMVSFDSTKCDDYFGFWSEINNAKQYLDKTNNKDTKFFLDESTAINFMNMNLKLCDFDSQTINLDNEEFKKSMELAKPIYQMGTAPIPPLSQQEEMYYSLIKNCNPIFNENINSYAFYMLRATPAEYEPEVLAIRNESGNVTSRIYDFAVVRGNSENLQNAYNFIKIILSTEMQEKSQGFMGFPVNNIAFKNRLDKHRDNMNGELNSADYSFEQAGATMNKLSQQNYDKILDIFNSIDSCYFGSEGINIIANNMEPYLNDEKSYEECLKKAEDKLEIYVSE